MIKGGISRPKSPRGHRRPRLSRTSILLKISNIANFNLILARILISLRIIKLNVKLV